MPDISELNGNPLANMSEFDGIPFYAGVPVPTAAYSVRLLGSGVGVSSYTGPAMRVRRDTNLTTGDDDEADIAFDSGVISLDSAISNASVGVTATTLGQFLNVGTVGGTTYTNPDSLTVTASCWVDEWKDQSGNGNHITQGTFGSQPQIHDGTVNTDLIRTNGEPSILFGTASKMQVSSITYSSPSDRLDTYAVVLFNSLPSASPTYNGSVGFFNNQIRSIANQNNLRAMNSSVRLGPSISTSTQYSAYWRLGGTYTDDASLNLSSAINGGTLTGLTSGTINPNVLQINQDNLSNMNLQEMLVYNPPSDQARATIELDINGYFSIY